MGVLAPYDEAAISKNSAVIVARLSDRLARWLRRSSVGSRMSFPDFGTIPASWNSSGRAWKTTSTRCSMPCVMRSRSKRRTAHGGSGVRAPDGTARGADECAGAGYRLGHELVLEFARDETGEAGTDPRMSLAVFERVTAVTFRYVDWISQEVVGQYEQSVKDGSSTATACARCALRGARSERCRPRRDHLGDPLSDAQNPSWRRPVVARGDDARRRIDPLERILRELTESLQAQGSSLFVAADRVSAWGWIPLHPPPLKRLSQHSAVRRQRQRPSVNCARVAVAGSGRVPSLAQASSARAGCGDCGRSRSGIGDRRL